MKTLVCLILLVFCTPRGYTEYEFVKYDLENETTGEKETVQSSIVVITNEDILFDPDSLFLSVPIRKVSDKTKFKIIQQNKFKRYGLDTRSYFVGDERTRTTINFIIGEKFSASDMSKTVNTLSVAYSSQR